MSWSSYLESMVGTLHSFCQSCVSRHLLYLNNVYESYETTTEFEFSDTNTLFLYSLALTIYSSEFTLVIFFKDWIDLWNHALAHLEIGVEKEIAQRSLILKCGLSEVILINNHSEHLILRTWPFGSCLDQTISVYCNLILPST